MRILVLGGTAFIGRAIVERAVAEDHEVTLFGRGRTGAGLFPGLERLAGDRDGDHSALERGDWDAVVDVSGFLPHQVNGAMDALGDRVGRYLFISSVAVYVEEEVEPQSDEDAPRRDPARHVAHVRDLDNSSYGPSKVACEDDVRRRFGSRATIVRPGRVVGPHDPHETLTYWLRRAARGGRVALPAAPGHPVQLVDSRDLATLVTRLLTDDRPGAFHAVGPARPTTIGEVIAECAAAVNSEVEIVPVESAARVPLVHRGRTSQQRSPARALAAGMTATALERTIADTREWDRARGEPPIQGGLSIEEETNLLARHGFAGTADR